jgi:nucleoside-diphosphate-sugar epimerase
MTSTPTKAMLAAAAGQGYHISFGGRCMYQYADDTAKAFLMAARATFEGAEVFSLGGSAAHMTDIVAAIEAAAPDATGKITFEPTPLPLPETADDAAFSAALGSLDYRPLNEAVAETISIFRTALSAGRLKV